MHGGPDAAVRLLPVDLGPGIRAVFSERGGGCSSPPYASLNAAFHVGDDPLLVAANRRRIADRAGLNLASWVVGAQVHGTAVRVVGPAERGRGALGTADALAATDALVTDQPGLVLVVLVADCVPVMLVDPERPAVGLLHAGWRGTAAHVALETVIAMRRAFGSRPGAMRAVIGPSIGPQDYLVGPDVAGALRAAYPGQQDQILTQAQDGHASADLWRANGLDLRAAGLPDGSVRTLGISTARETARFYSHRAEGPTGRFAACLALSPGARGR
jgi:YfiH family protein